jgi:hypothetical protein
VVKQRIATAVVDAQSIALDRAVELVNLMRELHHLSKHATSDAHATAVTSFSEAVHGEDPEKLHIAVGLFVAGQGDCKPSLVA